MKGLYGIGIVCLLLWTTMAQAEVSLIRNGSFEMDGQISDITLYPPSNWNDVNVPVSKFSGFVSNDWDTNGSFSLALATEIYATFQKDDAATVAQCLFIGNVNQIAFDLLLNTQYPTYYQWDSNLFSAIITIDGNAIWDSNQAGLNANGVYHIEVNDISVVPGSHFLGIGIRANTAAPIPYYYYYIARWDSIWFSSTEIYPPADFNHDCIVDIYDLQTFANGWLESGGPDLNGDGVNDFADYAVFASDWMLGCTEVSVEPNFIDPPQTDFTNDGVIGLDDLLVFCEDWLGGGGPCVRSDLNGDGLVDFVDFALFAETWQ
ncbi:MAG: hypothetical protein ABSB25_03255 [Sedimentisphaerales bacterium]|jgi:hypothetical protein